ncbi:hypothetical protein GCM10017687_49030 [Streptomyces echinatus]
MREVERHGCEVPQVGRIDIADTVRVLRVLHVPAGVAEATAAALDADGDGRVGEADVVPAFARYFTVPE